MDLQSLLEAGGCRICSGTLLLPEDTGARGCFAQLRLKIGAGKAVGISARHRRVQEKEQKVMKHLSVREHSNRKQVQQGRKLITEGRFVQLVDSKLQ